MRDAAIERASLPNLLARSDVVSLHVPLTDSTLHMIDAEVLAAMRPSTVLINRARGPVVSEPALLDARRSGHLGGAGLDVFEVEPPPGPSPFAPFNNVVLTPYHSPGTRDTMVI